MHRGVCTSCVNKVWRGVLFEFYKIVFLASETYLFGVFEYVGCMFRFDAFDQMHFSVVVGIAYCVKACAVHGHRVERCEDAYIGHLYGCRVRHAVAVHRQVVCHIDVEHVFFADMVYNSFGRFCHRFLEDGVGRNHAPCVGKFVGTASGVDISFSGRRSYAYGYVFERAAHASHRVSFEVRQHHQEVVVEEFLAHYIVFQVFAVGDGDFHLTLGVEVFERLPP